MNLKRIVFSLARIAGVAAVPVEREIVTAPQCSVELFAWISNPFDTTTRPRPQQKPGAALMSATLRAKSSRPGTP